MRLGRGTGAELQARNPEIEHLQRTVASEEQILRLDVAMHDVSIVRRLESGQRLVHQRQHLSVLQLAALAYASLFECLALEQLHHQKRDAIFGQAVVIGRYGAAVPDLVGGVAFTHEALSRVVVRRDLGVQDLDRDALGVAVSRCVNRRHAAHTHELVEVPSAIEECADARLCAQSYEVGLFHVGLSPRRYGRVQVGLRRGPGRQKPTAGVLLPLNFR